MKRHAYCIIAHNDAYCLEKLISLIDDERNDIILVLDKKSKLINSFVPKTKFSKVYQPDKNQLIDVQWGGLSLLKAEILALSIAVKKDKYDYIHIISGVDLPIKTQDYIHNFFDNLEPGTNCISFSEEKNIQDAFNENCKYYHIFTNKARCKNLFVRKICSFTRRFYIKLQMTLGIKRNWEGWVFGKGSEWVSLTYDFANYLVENRKKVFKRFRGVHCSDEIWKHTMLLSSPYKDTTSNFDSLRNDVRRIDWNRGTPYTWTIEDFEELRSCREMFARKFNSDRDKEIIDRIFAHVKTS